MMFCLFRDSIIRQPYHFLVNLISLGPVLYWFYFALVEKQFIEQFIAGQSLFVDLLLGLPVVLIFAIVIYAMLFWVLKLVIILLFPSWVEKRQPLQAEEDALEDHFDPAVDDIGVEVTPIESEQLRSEEKRPDSETPK